MEATNQRPPARPPRRFRHYGITGVAALSLLVTQCAPPQCAPAAPPSALATLSPALQQVVQLTNDLRAQNGLPPLDVNAQLNASAARMSNDMAAHNTIQPGPAPHVGSDGTDPGQRISAAGYVWRSWAEYIASGYPDATSVVQGWWNSDGHRRNLLSTAVTEIGVAVSYSASGVAYWTQDFGRPR
jgi:uncharacterized protein YkwD